MTEARPLLEVEDLHTEFDVDGAVVHAVRGVSWHVETGEILGIVGETGSGKSVTARSILGLVPPPGRVVRGKAIFDGLDLLELSEERLQRIRGKEIGLIVQNARAALNPLHRLGRQITTIYRAHNDLSRDEALERARMLLEAVGFDDPDRVLESYPHQVSGGMAQRVLIAITLCTGARLVIADEPTSGLDATVQLDVLDLARRMFAETDTACVLITHDLAIVARYCRRVVVMRHGQVVESATTADFFAAPQHPYSRLLVSTTAVAPPAAAAGP